MPSSRCSSYESNRQGPAEDRSEKGFCPFQPFPGRPAESQAAFSFRTFPYEISHLCLKVNQTLSDSGHQRPLVLRGLPQGPSPRFKAPLKPAGSMMDSVNLPQYLVLHVFRQRCEVEILSHLLAFCLGPFQERHQLFSFSRILRILIDEQPRSRPEWG